MCLRAPGNLRTNSLHVTTCSLMLLLLLLHMQLAYNWNLIFHKQRMFPIGGKLEFFNFKTELSFDCRTYSAIVVVT